MNGAIRGLARFLNSAILGLARELNGSNRMRKKIKKILDAISTFHYSKNMNNTMNTTTTDNEILSLAALTHADLPGYDAFLDTLDAACEDCEPVDGDDMSEYADDQQDDDSEPREDNFRDDVDADANALAGAGYGTDEDYGYYGEDNGWD